MIYVNLISIACLGILFWCIQVQCMCVGYVKCSIQRKSMLRRRRKYQFAHSSNLCYQFKIYDKCDMLEISDRANKPNRLNANAFK